MKTRRILTKNRIKALDLALSLDDVLYAKFRKMDENFQKQVRRWHRENQVVKVVRINGKYLEDLQIVTEVKTGDGIYLEVK